MVRHNGEYTQDIYLFLVLKKPRVKVLKIDAFATLGRGGEEVKRLVQTVQTGYLSAVRKNVIG